MIVYFNNKETLDHVYSQLNGNVKIDIYAKELTKEQNQELNDKLSKEKSFILFCLDGSIEGNLLQKIDLIVNYDVVEHFPLGYIHRSGNNSKTNIISLYDDMDKIEVFRKAFDIEPYSYFI